MSENKYDGKTYYKGFNADMTCRGFQFEEGGEYEEAEAILCNSGFHACELPHAVFGHYNPGESVFHKVELGSVSTGTEDDSKRVGTQIRIGANIDVKGIVRIAVSAFFDWFGFDKKIEKAKEATDNNAGDCGAANAGNYGAARAGRESKITVGKYSVAYGAGKACKVSGGLHSILALAVVDDDGEIIGIAHEAVDGERIKENTFYTLVNGQFTECEKTENDE